MRNRAFTTIAALGLVSTVFLALMSMLYLDRIPSKADLGRLEEDLRREHNLYLAAASPIGVELVQPEKEDDRSGLVVTCVLRPDLRARDGLVDLYLDRIAESVLSHPQWTGRVGYVTVRHPASTPPRSRTRQTGTP